MRKSTLAVALWVSTALLVTACSSGGSDSSTPPPPGNTIPVANSGPDQTVDAGVTVTLDGSGSSDADGTLAAYTWTQTAGSPTVTLSNRTVAQPTFQRSEEHTSELQSQSNLVCRLLLEKKKIDCTDRKT